MLKCEQNTPEMADRVLAAAAAEFDVQQRELQVDFEHGQWWVTRLGTGAQWAVCDAEGPGSTPDAGFDEDEEEPGTAEGFSFEQVSEGEED